MMGWRRRCVLANVILALTVLPTTARADDWVDCAGKDTQRAISGCSAIIDAGTDTAKNLAGAYNNRGLAYRKKGDADRAVKDYNRAIKLDPEHASAYYNRGLVSYDKGKFDQALKDYDRAIELDPKQGDYFNSRCWVRAVMGTSLALARNDCDAGLTLSSNDPAILDSRGLVGIKQGQFEKAWADYDVAHRGLPKNASILYGRGIAALRLGRSAEGNADLAAAMKLDGKIAETYAGYGVLPP